MAIYARVDKQRLIFGCGRRHRSGRYCSMIFGEVTAHGACVIDDGFVRGADAVWQLGTYARDEFDRAKKLGKVAGYRAKARRSHAYDTRTIELGGDNADASSIFEFWQDRVVAPGDHIHCRVCMAENVIPDIADARTTR